ncbi:hypothetical protein C8Q80DRAFT_1173010 [Daedaleopsis nitida]|nr:hypothetical protein C8Q80DRAFT_1173010 [Daedaleopsis nitida]
MTMETYVHTLFDPMRIWLEPENAENTYRVCYNLKNGQNHLLRWLGIPETITFSTPDGERLPVPARRYLQLHGVCARVAHLSGAAEYVLDILIGRARSREDVRGGRYSCSLVPQTGGSSTSVSVGGTHSRTVQRRSVAAVRW